MAMTYELWGVNTLDGFRFRTYRAPSGGVNSFSSREDAVKEAERLNRNYGPCGRFSNGETVYYVKPMFG